MNIPAHIRLADNTIERSLKKLEEGTEEDKELLKFLNRAFEDIEKNAFCGTQISKKLIPKEYIKKYNARNLWKYNLPGAWRLLYTVGEKDVKVLAIILEWLNHKDYERRFKY